MDENPRQVVMSSGQKVSAAALPVALFSPTLMFNLALSSLVRENLISHFRNERGKRGRKEGEGEEGEEESG